MFARHRHLSGVFWLLCIGVLVAWGCNSSPFLAAQFATNLSNFLGPGQGQTTQPTTTTTPADNNTPITSVCDLPSALRNVQVALVNESPQFVRFSMTFVVSAGPGGFVSCSDEISRYEQAGYNDLCTPNSCRTVSIGCDTVTLVSGTRMLGLAFGINQGVTATLDPNTGGTSGSAPVRQLTLANGSSSIPLPEIIVFGNDNPDFICLGSDVCTQNGFVYTSPPPANLPIGKSIEALRIQGTVCNERVGTAPEWRLDKTPFNTVTASFQFAAGGTITATVLDRSSDALTNTRNQAVWLVTDAGGNTIHFEER
jgi:hypothetical protein